MRPHWIALLLAVAGASGCQHTRLLNATANQASTLSDLQYQQVLDNLAMFAHQPDALPYYSLAGSGLTSTGKEGSAGGTFGWSLFNTSGAATNWFFNSAGASPAARLTTTQQWSTTSSTNPIELFLMRCVYQKTVGRPGCRCDELLAVFFKTTPDWLAAMQPGWYGVGPKHLVPKDACYVGHHCGTSVWVGAGQIDELTRVALAILDIATTPDTEFAKRLSPTGAADQERITELDRMIDELTVPAGEKTRLKQKLREAASRPAATLGIPQPGPRKPLVPPLQIPLSGLQ